MLSLGSPLVCMLDSALSLAREHGHTADRSLAQTLKQPDSPDVIWLWTIDLQAVLTGCNHHVAAAVITTKLRTGSLLRCLILPKDRALPDLGPSGLNPAGSLRENRDRGVAIDRKRSDDAASRIQTCAMRSNPTTMMPLGDAVLIEGTICGWTTWLDIKRCWRAALPGEDHLIFVPRCCLSLSA